MSTRIKTQIKIDQIPLTVDDEFIPDNDAINTEKKMTEKFLKTVVLFTGAFLLCVQALYTVVVAQ